MNPWGGLLAALEISEELLNQRRPFFGFESRDTLLILGFIFVLVVMLFAWAYFIRGRPNSTAGSMVLIRPRRSRRGRHGLTASLPTESGRRMRIRRRRRRRTEQDFPRNPTLGETGGLPPPRTDEPLEPPPAPSQT